jgi:hypothetical protein
MITMQIATVYLSGAPTPPPAFVLADDAGEDAGAPPRTFFLFFIRGSPL